MNPPSILQGAMSRERKPFTYTPGGLDLSEIKSERMAKRLMRNAMNQGVPEVPVHQIQSPPAPSTPIAVPNFNCLPFQVFPAMPANPRSLLRTRSHPASEQTKEPLIQRQQPNQYGNTYKHFQQNSATQPQTISQPTVDSPTLINNNNSNDNNISSRPASMFEYSSPPSYGSVNFTAPVLPEISYEAEYFETAAKPNVNNCQTPIQDSETQKNSFATNYEGQAVLKNEPKVEKIPKTAVVPSKEELLTNTEDDQREVRVVKKKETEAKSEIQNGDHNGNQNGESEAAVTVKIPTKKAGAKTETKVEVVQRTLPDGSLEEVKTTTTKTTLDGKTSITTKTETTIIPKNDDEEEYEEVEEEEEQEEDVSDIKSNEKDNVEEPSTVVILKRNETNNTSENKTNDQGNLIITSKESSEISSSRKVTVTQNNGEEELEEKATKEEVVETVTNSKNEVNDVDTEVNIKIKESAEVNDSVVEEVSSGNNKNLSQENGDNNEETEVVVSVKLEEKPIEKEKESEEKESQPEIEIKLEAKQIDKKEDENESEYTEEEYESEVEQTQEVVKTDNKSVEETLTTPESPAETKSEELAKETILETSTKDEELKSEEQNISTPQSEIPAEKEHNIEISYNNVPLREPSVPLEKVEDVEIKPIGTHSNNVEKSYTENTEIKTTNNESSGISSRQTEYNRVENIVTVNKTTKILDQSYEQSTQQINPTMKTYFAPSRDSSISISPSKPYQPTPATPEPQQERRHSLLLERLSMERQTTPVENSYQSNYQYINQGFEHQRQWSQSQEPQSEVVNVSNVKPSKISNQEWFQQSRQENFTNVAASPITINVPPPQFNPPQKQPQNVPQYQTPPPPQQLQPQYQQPQYQQPQYKAAQTQPKYEQPQHHYQAQFQPKQQQYQKSNITSPIQDRPTSHVYQQQTSYPPYIPQSTWENNSNTVSTNTQSNQYSFSNQTSESYQNTSQQYSSSYVPPPWEQDSTYNAVNNTPNKYQPPAPELNSVSTTSFSPSTNQSWKSPKPQSKFSRATSTSYTPPAPNQSFVRSESQPVPPKLPGRNTYYSEYERRYITVPESTYIPAETKFQAQPDPSPQYYFAKDEPVETVEPQWRKELREFTEKSQTYQSEQTSVRPPWEEEVQYAKNPTVKYTPTPSWSQTIRPQSWRERSFDAECVATQDFSKTTTLGRSRPLSTYETSEIDSHSHRSRGMSVDRYNPVYYKSPIPSEHPPVQVQTLTPETAPHHKGHQPPLPTYNSRASAEPRDQSAQFQQRRSREVKENPVQSRSFKYLQWITGTED